MECHLFDCYFNFGSTTTFSVDVVTFVHEDINRPDDSFFAIEIGWRSFYLELFGILLISCGRNDEELG